MIPAHEDIINNDSGQLSKVLSLLLVVLDNTMKTGARQRAFELLKREHLCYPAVLRFRDMCDTITISREV
jgi:hypothetical protein